VLICKTELLCITIYRMYHLKRIPTSITYCATEMKLGGPRPVQQTAPNLAVTLESRSPWWAEHVCIREYFFAMKSSVAVSKTYSKKVPNRSTIHQLVTTFRDTRSVCDKCSSSDKTEESTAVHIFQAVHQLQQ
jgi:hypothetical protein